MLVLPHLEDGRKATFMFLPEGDDPDSVIRREGKEGFLKRVDSGLDVSAWLFQKLSSDLADAGHDLDSISGKAALAKERLGGSVHAGGAFRQLMVDEVGQRTGLRSNDSIRWRRALNQQVTQGSLDQGPVASARKGLARGWTNDSLQWRVYRY